MSSPILYGAPQSTYVRTARMAFHEKGAAYALEPIEIGSPAHLELHPFAKMPVMRHGDLVMYETAAITQYADETFDGPPLRPAEPLALARMAQWISIHNCYFYNDAIRRYVLQYVFPKGADGGPDRTTIDAALPDLRRDLKLLDDAYGESAYLAGEGLSLADLFIAPCVFYLRNMPESGEMLQEHSNLLRAMAAIEQRSSFAETMPPPPPS